MVLAQRGAGWNFAVAGRQPKQFVVSSARIIPDETCPRFWPASSCTKHHVFADQAFGRTQLGDARDHLPLAKRSQVQL